MSMVSVFSKLSVLVLAVIAATAARGGTGAGNEFFHLVNPTFDFHVATPTTWGCEGCPPPSAPVELQSASRLKDDDKVWTIIAPEKTTWLKVTFLSNFPATDKASLLAEIKLRLPDDSWQDMDRSEFAGYTSSPDGDAANAATEFYLVVPGQVIRLDWQKDGNAPTRALQLNQIKASIDRASQPPSIKGIRTERQTAYNVGERACYLMEVDDLRTAFSDTSLAEFEIEGAPKHWSFKTIAWLPEQDSFEVCFKVTAAFKSTGLRITSVLIKNEDSDTELSCATDDWKPGAPFGCNNESGGDYHVVPTQIAPVNNAEPVVVGPLLTALSFDKATMTLSLAASSPTGVYGAELIGDGDSDFVNRLLVYPDQINKGTGIPLAAMTHTGWNTVTQIVLYDINGLATLYQKAASTNPRREPRRSAPQGDGDTVTYQMVPWSGSVQATTFPVIAFLKGDR